LEKWKFADELLKMSQMQFAWTDTQFQTKLI
jgi:hypothetical protein